MAHLYGLDIPTVMQSHPALPGVLGNVDTNRAICAGTPMHPEDQTHSKFVASRLKASQGKESNRIYGFLM
jgi:hypothetical protein